MYDFITDLLNIDRNLIKSLDVVKLNDEIQYHITLFQKPVFCPFCGGTTHSNGYNRAKRINHPHLTDQRAVIVSRSNRRQCNECLKTFTESNPFSFPAFRNSFLALSNTLKLLGNLNYTFSMIAINNHISVTQVQRYFDSFVTVHRLSLPECIGIDEIYSKMANRANSAYLCVMVDHQSRTLFELLPTRSKAELIRYFSNIPKAERDKVKYLTIDMWEPYKQVVELYLKNCTIAVDPFHVVKHLMECFSRIRLNIFRQCEYGSDTYYLLKTWKDLLERDVFLDNKPVYNSRFKKHLNKRNLLDMILDVNENLTLGFRLKEMYLKFNKEASSENCTSWFESIYQEFILSEIPEFNEFISILSTWKQEILNSFIRPYDDRKLSNALTENINGKLKTYIQISKGISNFKRFRKRCIFALNKKVFYSISDSLCSDKRIGKKRGPYKKS
ncbi:ISL3 family transposase [Longicatena caecimuris]|uniref:ISL3 family transposase n=1 Tax=Longicatena caecimuris TaxID=1796635 RepID=UPI0022DF757F|nr:ISL3 family transposase [Longicatena caecimuris]